MKYKNGTEAKSGDIVITKIELKDSIGHGQYKKDEKTGVVTIPQTSSFFIVAGMLTITNNKEDIINGNIMDGSSVNTSVKVSDCYLAEDCFNSINSTKK